MLIKEILTANPQINFPGSTQKKLQNIRFLGGFGKNTTKCLKNPQWNNVFKKFFLFLTTIPWHGKSNKNLNILT